ncbi:MAG TPA: YCF48-related protein [Anaerolineaceae bacterium]|jgi:photosystem II stability/assembly factor-like uncharacterized protein
MNLFPKINTGRFHPFALLTICAALALPLSATLPAAAQTAAETPQSSGWVDLSSHIVSTRGTPNLHSMDFIGQEGWIGSGSLPEIYHTIDGGLTFEVQTLPTEINALAMRNTLEGYAGGQNGRIYHTTDGGAAWVSIGTLGKPVRGLSCPPSGSTCYAVGDYGSAAAILGTAITLTSTGVVATHLDSVSFPVDSTEGWLCGGGIIRHFIDGAWQADQTYPNNGYNAIAFGDHLNGWAVGDEGVIAHTTDGGKTDGSLSSAWHTETNPDPRSPRPTLNDVDALNASEAWAVGNSGTILHTTDGGQTWTIEASGLTNEMLVSVHAEDRQTVYVAGSNGVFLKYTSTAPALDRKIFLPMALRDNP